MYTDWTKHLKDEQDKKDFERTVQGSSQALNRLLDLITEYQDTISLSENDIRIFDQPNWEYRQAFKNGQRCSLQKIRDLINNATGA